MAKQAPYLDAVPEETWWLYFYRATVVFSETGVTITSIIIPDEQDFSGEVVELLTSFGRNLAVAIPKAMKELDAWKRRLKERMR